MVTVVPLFSTEHSKGRKTNVMDKIWDRKILSKSEVIGRCGGDEKKRMTTQNRQKSNAKKQNKNCGTHVYSYVSNVCDVQTTLNTLMVYCDMMGKL